MLHRVLPRGLYQILNRRRELRDLLRLEKQGCDASTLRDSVPNFASVPEQEWLRAQTEAAALGLGDQSGAVNFGDRRAIYQLARALRAASVLEVGTHLGASTTMLSLALRDSGNSHARLVTVDIKDVNSPEQGPWKEFGYKYSPRQMVQSLGCNFVHFVASPSVPFLQSCAERFDLIFLDGGHEATTVYQEVPAALKLLNPGGLILLHDFYPNAQPLWSDGVVVPGPWLAMQRFESEGAAIKAWPLGALPWPTKLQSSVTSLACLVKL